MEGKISISRMHSNQPDEQDIIRIRLEDETSGIEFVEIRLTPEALGLAITGLSMQECSFELRGIQLVGKKRETKDEVIATPDGDFWKWGKEEKSRYLAQFETEGWKVQSLSDFGNHHRRVGEHSYRVTFIRFVEVAEEE